MSANQLALAIRVPVNRITAILRGERAVTAETAVRLGRYLGTGAAFWMNLQTAHAISVIDAGKGRLIEDEIPPDCPDPGTAGVWSRGEASRLCDAALRALTL